MSIRYIILWYLFRRWAFSLRPIIRSCVFYFRCRQYVFSLLLLYSIDRFNFAMILLIILHQLQYHSIPHARNWHSWSFSKDFWLSYSIHAFSSLSIDRNWRHCISYYFFLFASIISFFVYSLSFHSLLSDFDYSMNNCILSSLRSIATKLFKVRILYLDSFSFPSFTSRSIMLTFTFATRLFRISSTNFIVRLYCY